MTEEIRTIQWHTVLPFCCIAAPARRLTGCFGSGVQLVLTVMQNRNRRASSAERMDVRQLVLQPIPVLVRKPEPDVPTAPLVPFRLESASHVGV